MLKSTICALAVLFSSLDKVCSQEVYQSGYAVLSGDTLKGTIKIESMNTSQQEVWFKDKSNAEAKILSPTIYTAFGVGSRTFQSHLVNISMGSIEPTRLSVGIDTNFITATVFMKVIKHGINVSLLSYADNIKVRYYIKKVGIDQPFELMLYRYNSSSDKSNSIIERNYYRAQLLQLFNDFKVSKSKNDNLLKLNYTEEELLSVVNTINNDRLFDDNKNFYIDYLIGGGMSLMSSSFIGKHPFLGNSINQSSPAPYFNVGFDAYASPVTRRLKFRGQLGYLFANTEFVTKTSGLSGSSDKPDVIGVKHQAFSAEMSTIYNFYRTSAFTLSAGWGVTFLYINNGTVNYDVALAEFYMPLLPNTSFGYPFALSVIVKDKFELLGKYSLPVYFTGNTIYGLNVSRLQFGFNYIFTKYKSAKKSTSTPSYTARRFSL